ncbi:MAG: N-acetylmuramoyl-L-alanine amidase [Bacteroidales bacterium]|nr:N-acetylmuramoyl-L-alanine amidase [Bacteroidales bacterium]
MKRLLLFFVIAFFVICLPVELKADRRGFVTTVVIDPGHGGREPGAIGRRAMEKNLTLAIALKLGQYIRENLEDVEVIFTRETDVFVPLHERARIANENNADLFISLHCNSATNRNAMGTETFVMGLHRSQANLEVARRENKSILYEDDYLETYDGFDPNSPEANIIFALYQNAYLDQSLQMAALVQEQFRERARRIDRGVKQAGFLVLYHITMPGILIETGFISNAREEEYLMSETGQAHIASAIFRAFRQYKEEQDALAASRIHYADLNHTSAAGASGTGANAEAGERSHTGTEHETTNASETHSEVNISFRVQFATSSEKRAVDDEAFRGLERVSWYFHEGLYKYTVGNEPSLEAAANIQREVQEAGFPDAFVVAFLNEERISASEAIRHLQDKNSQ